jgi:ketosteroid isomerase-like protein
MPVDNVTVLKEAFDFLAQEGTPNFDAIDPEIEMINFDTFPVTRPYYGWDGVVEWFVDMSEPFDDFKFELVDVLGYDDERVVTTYRVTGGSRMGGPHFELIWGAVTTFRDGKIVKVEGFRTPEEALAAAGLA